MTKDFDAPFLPCRHAARRGRFEGRARLAGRFLVESAHHQSAAAIDMNVSRRVVDLPGDEHVPATSDLTHFNTLPAAVTTVNPTDSGAAKVERATPPRVSFRGPFRSSAPAGRMAACAFALHRIRPSWRQAK
jgi:hypothetical protein